MSTSISRRASAPCHKAVYTPHISRVSGGRGVPSTHNPWTTLPTRLITWAGERQFSKGTLQGGSAGRKCRGGEKGGEHRGDRMDDTKWSISISSLFATELAGLLIIPSAIIACRDCNM